VKFASDTVGLRAQSVCAGEARTAPGTRSKHDALKKGTYTGSAGRLQDPRYIFPPNKVKRQPGRREGVDRVCPRVAHP